MTDAPEADSSKENARANVEATTDDDVEQQIPVDCQTLRFGAAQQIGPVVESTCFADVDAVQLIRRTRAAVSDKAVRRDWSDHAFGHVSVESPGVAIRIEQLQKPTLIHVVKMRTTVAHKHTIPPGHFVGSSRRVAVFYRTWRHRVDHD